MTSLLDLIRQGGSLCLLFPLYIHAQEGTVTPRTIPFTKVFYNLDGNLLGSFTHDYGAEYLLAGSGTYGIVKSGIDWNLYRMDLKNPWISNVGFASVFAGMIVPMTVPLGLYLYGHSQRNPDLQVTGLALGQAAALGLVISSGIKVFTGRVPPDNHARTTDYSGDFQFGFYRGGAFDGWPSSHTTVAFAMASALTELHPENTALGIGAYAFATLIGLGVSTNIHWFSDAFAGAFIGYAIGKTVGASFRELTDPTLKGKAYRFYLTPTGAGLAYRF